MIFVNAFVTVFAQDQGLSSNFDHGFYPYRSICMIFEFLLEILELTNVVNFELIYRFSESAHFTLAVR